MKNYKKLESIDMTELLESISQETPKESVIFVEKSLELVNYIFTILEKKGINQKELATRLGKSEAEVSKWLTGSHNLTLRSISKIEAALETDIIHIPKLEQDVFIEDNAFVGIGEIGIIIPFNPNPSKMNDIDYEDFNYKYN